MDQGSVACQVLDLFVGDDKTADSLSQVNQETGVSNVIFCDFSLIITSRCQILSRAGAEDGQTHNGVTDHGGTVLYKH